MNGAIYYQLAKAQREEISMEPNNSRLFCDNAPFEDSHLAGSAIADCSYQQQLFFTETDDLASRKTSTCTCEIL